MSVRFSHLIDIDESEATEELRMKKMILGIVWQLSGFFGAVIILCTASLKEWDYYGIEGTLGALLGTKLMIPLVICVLLFIAGLVMSLSDIKKNDDR